ncbi:MAG TPA: Uma2 family endonuclease [Flavisolibacter sp.]|nr:Uma2 family endonuclease [Flavisolibacter sp.]
MFTVYNEEEDNYILVEEPDPSLTYTYADYLQWKFEERVELIKGKIFKMSPAPNLKHQQVSMRLSNDIYNFLKGKTCQVFVAPFDVRLPVKNKKKPEQITTVVQPDICIVCNESKLDERGCCGAPDLVIEILSPGNSQKEVRIKHQLYEEASVKEYWVVYPAEESIAVFHLGNNGCYDGANIYAAGDAIRSIAVDGLVVLVTDVFSNS